MLYLVCTCIMDLIICTVTFLKVKVEHKMYTYSRISTAMLYSVMCLNALENTLQERHMGKINGPSPK